jgi:hypothetical protein
VVGRCLQRFPAPGGPDDLKGAGVCGDEEDAGRDVPLVLQLAHRLQQGWVPEASEVCIEEALE